METPSPKYFCPRCRAAYDVDHNYCGRCGADMHRASRLAHAEDAPADPGASATVRHDRRAGPDRDRWLGRVVDGRYRVVEILGQGGMGVVYKVEHQRMGKIAAMKVLHHDLAGEPEIVRRFHREAEAVSRLAHPNSVQVFDFGTAKGALYLVMEYVRGLDLGSLVDRDGALPFERAAPLFIQIADALAEAHELGVIHRDLKPENVLVTRTHGGHDFVKVLDFGLAKVTERDESPDITTHSGSIIGTPYTMSPEQIRGEDIDARTDLYSLGALMYRTLTGENAHDANTPVGVLTKHLTERPIPPSRRRPDLDIDPQVDDIVARAMAKKRDARYPDAGELAQAIRGALRERDGSGPARSAPAPTAATAPAERRLADDIDYGIDTDRRLRRSDIDAFERRITRRRRIHAAVIPALLLAAAGAGGYAFVHRGESPRTAEAEPNGRLETATAIASGAPARGKIGRRHSETESDRDVYRVVPAPAEAGSTATLRVTALPNMDLQVGLYDPSGRLLARADEGGVGDGEWIRRRRIDRPVYAIVSEAIPRGSTRLPTENVSDEYAITATIAPFDPRLETEPNDAEPEAMTLRPGAPVTGYLAARDDVDLFAFEGEPGRYRVAISGAESVPLTWRAGASEATTDRRTNLKLEPGDIVRLERDDRDGPKPAPGTDEPYTIDVVAASRAERATRE